MKRTLTNILQTHCRHKLGVSADRLFIVSASDNVLHEGVAGIVERSGTIAARERREQLYDAAVVEGGEREATVAKHRSYSGILSATSRGSAPGQLVEPSYKVSVELLADCNRSEGWIGFSSSAWSRSAGEQCDNAEGVTQEEAGCG